MPWSPSGFPSHVWWYRTVSINSMNIPLLKFHIFHSQSMQYPHSSTIFVGSIPIKPYKTLCFAIFSQDFPMIYSTLSPPPQPPVPGHPFGMPAAQRPARLHHGRHGALRHWDDKWVYEVYYGSIMEIHHGYTYIYYIYLFIIIYIWNFNVFYI